MALSQVQCLDNDHVNPRTSESKPEFLYCEDQRLALEALLRGGREAFLAHLRDRGLRGFLSDPELEALAGAAEPFDPGSEAIFPGNAGDGDPALSLRYWPEVSDASAPRMDLGWPDSDAYRGVTRVTVHTQPPLDGQAHIKEIVRKMIAQAQRVIAVVMDVFTDVDIFRDLLSAGFKRRVSVYILLEHTALPHFLSMCQRANMHAGHLKHLRVRCTEGAEFYTRSCTKVRGQLGHRFMFIDGDKAVSGSYSFTWMSSRLNRNLITVVKGQAVEAFDRLFHFLFLNSSSVDLRQVTTEPEPEPEPLPQPAPVAPPSAAFLKKLYNPKYALVAAGNQIPSAGNNNSPNEPENSENSKEPEVPETKKRGRRRSSKDAAREAPRHPGLINLEKACLISYLPTWPEPDPPSDVIGFINIRDTTKPTPLHLQRSEMFETSQAIRFSTPFSMPKETLPEVSQPRHPTAKHEQMNKLQPTQNKTKAEESVVDGVEPTQLNAEPGDIKTKGEAPEKESSASEQKSQPDKDTTKSLNTGNKLHSHTPTNQGAGHNTTPHLSAHTLFQSSTKTSTPDAGRPPHTTQTVTTKGPAVDRTHTLESITNSHSNSEKTEMPQTDSHTQVVHTQQHTASVLTPKIQTPAISSHISTSSASVMHPQSISSSSCFEKNPISILPVNSRTATSVSTSQSSTSCFSSVPHLISSTVLNPPLPPSSSLISTHPIPKPRTVQMVIRDDGTGTQKRPEHSKGQLVLHSKPDVEIAVQTPPEKEPATVPQLQNNNRSKTGAQIDSENTGSPEEAPQQKQNVASRGTEDEETVGPYDDRAAKQSATGTKPQAQSVVLITAAPKADSVNIQEIITKVEPKSMTSTDCKITTKTETDCKATEKARIGCEVADAQCEKSENVIQHKTYLERAHERQRISYCELNPLDTVESVYSLKSSTHAPVSATPNAYISKDSGDDSTRGQQGNPSVRSAHQADIKPNAAKHNTHVSITPQEHRQTLRVRRSTHTPERPLRLHLSDTNMPDLRSPTAEPEPRPIAAVLRTPTPDGFLPRVPDPRPYTPGSRTPTPDVGDGCFPPREASTLSTTSEEYYECSDSPFHDPVDSADFCSQEMTVDRDSFKRTNSPNVTTITTPSRSPSHVNNTIRATTLGGTDSNTSSSETQSLSWPVRVSTPSPLLEKVKIGEEKEPTNEENGREQGEKGRKISVTERRERGSRSTERRGRNETKRTADHLKQAKESTKAVEKARRAKPQSLNRKQGPSQLAAERPADRGVTQRELTSKARDGRRLSTGDIRTGRVSSEKPDKEKVVDKAAVRPSGVERRGRPQSTTDTEEQRRLRSPSKLSRGQQRDSGTASPSRPSRSPRPLSASEPLGARPSGSRQMNQAESKLLHGSFQVLHNTSFPCRPLSRPPPPLALGAVRPAAGKKQVKVSQSQQSLLSQQPQEAQSRAELGQSRNQHPYTKPQASFLHTHSNIQSHLHPHSQNQTVSQMQEEGRAPFTFSFSRLCNPKDLRDKVSTPPAQRKRGSTSPPVQGRKSTS